MGIGDWGLGIGDWGLGTIPNPQSPIPHPQPPIPLSYNIFFSLSKIQIIFKLIFIYLNSKNGKRF